MKRKVTSILLTLVLTLCLVGNAFAAGNTVESNDKSVTITGMDGATVSFKGTEQDQVEVTFTSTALKNGEQYIILMVSGETDESNPEVPSITESTIRYIDQQQVPATGNSVTFTVYPDKLQTSVILISSASTGTMIAAIVNAEFILGDVNGDGEVTIGDAMLLLQHLAHVAPREIDEAAADVNHANGVDIGDAMFLLQCLAGLQTLQ